MARWHRFHHPFPYMYMLSECLRPICIGAATSAPARPQDHSLCCAPVMPQVAPHHNNALANMQCPPAADRRPTLCDVQAVDHSENHLVTNCPFLHKQHATQIQPVTYTVGVLFPISLSDPVLHCTMDYHSIHHLVTNTLFFHTVGVSAPQKYATPCRYASRCIWPRQGSTGSCTLQALRNTAKLIHSTTLYCNQATPHLLSVDTPDIWTDV
jgi:hypothetical protein